ncbi:MAG: NADH-quinone oxidoreductase subunit M [Desulfobacterota bacterium]|nr:NADH-quinone oxidoreductase subunit M [Thermodesulfobacteriota bacterium]MDW8001857.1 NADH-quinone oxidoreductase subunit M [Deltaproteobacteria bacterium]
MMDLPILSILIFLPLIGAVTLLFVPREKELAIKTTALIFSVVEFFVSLPLFFEFDETKRGMQFIEKYPWFPEWGIAYHLGIDGISLLLILLTTFLTVLCVLCSWTDIKDKIKEYYISFLFLETAMVGTLCALDLVLFYVFWELMLVPMYLLIGVWGGPRRIYAAVKFFLYTMAGSVLMLLAIFALYYLYFKEKGIFTFDLLELYTAHIPISVQYVLFAAFSISFAIKVPMFPFHTWLPDAHTEAPTAGSVILAGVLLKMGTYGFIRFAIPLFPKAAYDAIPLMSVLAIIGIIYGAIVSMMQPDLKRLIAFSSVSHLGYVMLGMFAFNMQGVEGSIYQMLNHGISTGGLFLLVGMLYERRHTRMIADFGGLSSVMPVYAVFFMIVTLSSIALPGTNGFVGEFLILLGAFKAKKIYGILGATGVILGAVYMLWMFRRVMFGVLTHEENKHLKDLSKREIFIMSCIVFFIILMGVYPKAFFKKMDVSVEEFLRFVNERNAYYSKVEQTSTLPTIITFKGEK